MQDSEDTPQLRRATDKVARRLYDQIPSDNTCITNEHAATIHEEIEAIKRKLILIDSAFLRDDLAAVNYTGHRFDHLEKARSNLLISEYKASGTKVIIGIIITFVIGLMSSGFLHRVLEAVPK